MQAFHQPWEVVGRLFVVFGQMVYPLAEVVEMLQRIDFEVEAPVVVLKVYLVVA